MFSRLPEKIRGRVVRGEHDTTRQSALPVGVFTVHLILPVLCVFLSVMAPIRVCGAIEQPDVLLISFTQNDNDFEGA